MKVAIVVPVYNEKDTILELIETVKDCSKGSNDEVNIIIVDDNSPDGTAIIIRELTTNDSHIHLICRPRKMGLGSAYLDAFRWILSNLTVDVVIQMDGDMSHPPHLLQKMIGVIKMGGDVAIASRYSKNGGADNWPLHRKIISKGANLFVRLLLGVRIKDVTSGYKAFKINVIEGLLARKLSSKGYEYQIESIYIVSKMNKKIEEILSEFHRYNWKLDQIHHLYVQTNND